MTNNMRFWSDKRKRRIVIAVVAVFLVLVLVVGGCAVYLGDYYRADLDAINAYSPMQRVSVENSDGNTVFLPETAVAGFIFYPGGKVEHLAYAPLMAACAEQGILCVLVEMPFRLAVFDVNAAEGIQARYPDIQNWYIGGHSLGGSMAASYLEKHIEEYQGLILLGSYSTADLSDEDLDVLSVYGSEDKVLSKEKYDNYRSNLPTDFTEIVIDGGCHAYFGMYGTQDGDGTPTIGNAEQIDLTAGYIRDLIAKSGS